MLASRKQRCIALVAAITALCVGLLTAWQLTRGLTAFTSESWRRAAVIGNPRPLPHVVLQDQAGKTFGLQELCGRVLLINFVYTQCPGVCSALGGESAQLASRFAEPIQSGQMAVLSVSFDPSRDSPERLMQFKARWDPGNTGWRVTRPVSGVESQALLDAVGVVVIPDGRGGFDHNAALHIVDKSCRLTQIIDLEDFGKADAAVRRLM